MQRTVKREKTNDFLKKDQKVVHNDEQSESPVILSTPHVTQYNHLLPRRLSVRLTSDSFDFADKPIWESDTSTNQAFLAPPLLPAPPPPQRPDLSAVAAKMQTTTRHDQDKSSFWQKSSKKESQKESKKRLKEQELKRKKEEAQIKKKIQKQERKLKKQPTMALQSEARGSTTARDGPKSKLEYSTANSTPSGAKITVSTPRQKATTPVGIFITSNGLVLQPISQQPPSSQPVHVTSNASQFLLSHPPLSPAQALQYNTLNSQKQQKQQRILQQHNQQKQEYQQQHQLYQQNQMYQQNQNQQQMYQQNQQNLQEKQKPPLLILSPGNSTHLSFQAQLQQQIQAQINSQSQLNGNNDHHGSDNNTNDTTHIPSRPVAPAPKFPENSTKSSKHPPNYSPPSIPLQPSTWIPTATSTNLSPRLQLGRNNTHYHIHAISSNNNSNNSNDVKTEKDNSSSQHSTPSSQEDHKLISTSSGKQRWVRVVGHKKADSAGTTGNAPNDDITTTGATSGSLQKLAIGNSTQRDAEYSSSLKKQLHSFPSTQPTYTPILDTSNTAHASTIDTSTNTEASTTHVTTTDTTSTISTGTSNTAHSMTYTSTTDGSTNNTPNANSNALTTEKITEKSTSNKPTNNLTDCTSTNITTNSINASTIVGNSENSRESQVETPTNSPPLNFHAPISDVEEQNGQDSPDGSQSPVLEDQLRDFPLLDPETPANHEGDDGDFDLDNEYENDENNDGDKFRVSNLSQLAAGLDFSSFGSSSFYKQNTDLDDHDELNTDDFPEFEEGEKGDEDAEDDTGDSAEESSDDESSTSSAQSSTNSFDYESVISDDNFTESTYYKSSDTSHTSDKQFTVLPGETVDISVKLGKGATASVWSGIVRNRVVAVKRIELKSFSEGLKHAQKVVQREYDIVRSLKHDSIVQYHGLFYNKQEEQVNLVMELIVGVSVTDVVLYKKKLSEEMSAFILRGLLDGLTYLHDNLVIHRDLKPDNVLIDVSGHVKIIDFGTATQYSLTDPAKRRSTVGTPWYCAPEVINSEEYSVQCDIWSLGCMAIELVSGKPPFDDLNDISCLFKMAEGLPPPLPSGISSTCVQFLEKCLRPDWKERPTSRALQSDSFLDTDSLTETNRQLIITVINEMREVKKRHDQKQRRKQTKSEADGTPF